MFTPLRTPRVMLRPARGAGMATAPQPDEWWILVVADPDDAVTYGELALRLSSEGRLAEISYNLDPNHWGNGYATEAVETLVEWLFDAQSVSRVCATLHPDNLAAQLVLERSGFLYEAHTRLSSWVGDTNTDELLYATTREDWESWRTRPREKPADVELVELTEANNVRAERLKTHRSEERFVSPMAHSYADALFPEIIDGAPVAPWMRGVVADDEWVAFVMLALITEHHPEPYLWRLLVDRRHQRRGIGIRILDLLVAECRAMGAETLTTSWGEGRGSPRPFYERYGFEPTGDIDDGETVARLRF